MKINNQLLAEYVRKNESLKSLEKEVKSLKAEILTFLKDTREGKALITADFIASLKTREVKEYTVPARVDTVLEVKPKEIIVT